LPRDVTIRATIGGKPERNAPCMSPFGDAAQAGF